MNLLRRLLGEMETPRLVLRHWRESDLEDFLAFAADPAVMLDSGARPATTFEEEQAFFRRALWENQVPKGHPPPQGEQPLHWLRAGPGLLGPRLHDRGPGRHGALRL